jgi:hypothetical protein
VSRGPDAGTLLRRAIERDAIAAGFTILTTIAESTRWASATFVGAQHRLTLDMPDDGAAAAWLSRLSDADLPVRGHLVADVTVLSIERTAGRATVRVEALTVET